MALIYFVLSLVLGLCGNIILKSYDVPPDAAAAIIFSYTIGAGLWITAFKRICYRPAEEKKDEKNPV